MKGRLNLLIILAFYGGAIYSLRLAELSGVWEYYLKDVPVLTGFIEEYFLYFIYGSAALLTLSLLVGKKPRMLRKFFGVVLIILMAFYGYETYSVITSGLADNSLEYVDVAFVGIGTLFPLYLSIKMQHIKEKRR